MATTWLRVLTTLKATSHDSTAAAISNPDIEVDDDER